MGIPSFYRQLCRRFPRLITNKIETTPQWLCLDFNCAMYYVLREYQHKNPYSPTDCVVWETGLCEAIATYMTDIISLIKPTEGVYVACDGVVCAAKRRQQRLRRFKSPWMAALDASASASVPQITWDQNALTPGTAFMKQLGHVLKITAKAKSNLIGIPIIVSATDEPGEGEHKLMACMRRVKGSCVIYGLDADLILLAMLLHSELQTPVHLLREAQEFEDRQTGWRALDIPLLAKSMNLCDSSHVRDFVASMTLLGNDFLPRSLTRTVRDGGIDILLRELESVWLTGDSIVETNANHGCIKSKGLRELIKRFAQHEYQELVLIAQTALKRSRFASTLPAQWATVARLLNGGGCGDGDNHIHTIYKSWRPGTPQNYLQGVAWVWDYYSGRAVDQAWMFDEHLPPLWTDLYTAILKMDEVAPPKILYPVALEPEIHLLSVLPIDSIRRLVLPELQAQIGLTVGSWYMPTSWALFDVGRTQLWECEPILPQIPECVLRSLKLTTK